MSLEKVDPYNVIDFSEWQRIVDILAKLAGVESAAITRIELPYIEAFKLSASDNVPFYEGMTIELSNHYCEEIFLSKKRMHVTNALKEERWMHAPELKHGLISYLGYPIFLPSGEVFGTLCVHDSKENEYSEEIDSLMFHFKNVLESHFALADQSRQARESEARYKTLVENTADAIFLLNDRGEIQDVNTEACRRYGYSFPRFLQLNFRDLGMKQRSSGIDWWIQECLERGESVFEERHASWNGAEIPSEINARLIPHPESLTILAVARDISARKEAEQLREDIERITRHDLKTPLNGIISLPEMLLDSSNLNEDQREKIQMIRTAGYRMLDMINQSLSLYQMEQSTYECKASSIDIMPIIQDVKNDIQDLLNSYQVQLHVRVNGQHASENGSFFLWGENWLCYSMLGNLLRNAIEASPPGERVTIDLEDQGSQMAKMTITSRSVIPEEIRHRFGQKHVTCQKRFGTGLGVYSARLIAETMGGRFAWTSSWESGTAVSVYLPKSA